MAKIITPEMLAASGSEDGEQMALICWARFHENRKLYPELEYLHHIPNGGWRTKPQGARFKAMGVKRGIPDLHLPVKRGKWSGLYIEMKKVAKNGNRAGFVKIEQSDVHEFLKEQGYAVFVCRNGWDEARQTIIQYLEWKDPK